MKCKIFEVPTGKVLVMEAKENVEFYLQINSSDWYFCVGYKEDFDKVTEDNAMCIWDEYRDSVIQTEELIEDVNNDCVEITYKI